MRLSRYLDPRRSFAAKLTLAVLGTVGLLLAVMLLVVQAETRGQVELVTDNAVTRAWQAFEESERMRREQLARRAQVFTDNRRTVALLEEAIEAGDTTFLSAQIGYALQLTHFDSTSLTVLTDAAGDPLLTFMGDTPVPGTDPADVGPVARELLDTLAPELTAYRLVDGRLYTVRTVVLDLAGRVVGTTTFGQPIEDEDAAAVGRLVGAEVCFVAGDRCVAGTERARARLAGALSSLAAGERVMGERDGERWELVAEPLSDDGDAPWRLAIAVPLEPVLSPFDRIRRTLALGAIGALALAVLLGIILARGLSRPITALVSATGRVGRGEYDTHVPETSEDEVGQLARAFNAMTEGLALKEQYRGVLDKVVSKDVAEELLRGDLTLGGESRQVTVLFADIRGFTTLTEGMAPQEVIGLLNETMERLGNAVEAEGGVVDKYVGDEIMAVFGAPLRQPDHATRAVRAAAEMQRAMRQLSRERTERGEPPVHLGVGLNTGEAVAGNMGSPSRLNYTVVGESVNLAARLCSAAKLDEILISDVTRNQLQGDDRRAPDQPFEIHPSGSRELKGFSRSVDVYTVEVAERTERSRDGGRPGGVAARGAVLLALGGLAASAATVAAPTPAAGQSMPTLSGLGLEWISADGTVQLGLSGRADLEGYVPGDEPPWIIPETDPFLAGRARVFTDLFVGDRVFASAELRVDRGEEARAGPVEARIDQAFVRVGPFGPASLQAGKFVSPFGAWPQRHHTTEDPFIRPPVMYDHRTVIAPGIAPGAAGGFVAWKDDDPRDFRPTGAPPVWGAPYQWGAMVMAEAGALTFRIAAMNSAPSSGPDAWEWDADRLQRPSWVAGVAYQLSPELRLGASWDRGPYMEPPVEGSLDPGADADDYLQEIFALDAVYAIGRIVVRAEAMADRWEVPNVPDDAWDFSGYIEGQYDVATGAWMAARLGAIAFNELGSLDDSVYGPADSARWDYGVRRLQLAAGYRILRNAGIQAEYMVNHSSDPTDNAGNLLSAQLWWQY